MAQRLQVGDRVGDRRADQGQRLLDLALPLTDQMRRAKHQNSPESGQLGGGDADERLAHAHLADHGRAALLGQAQRGAADRSLLRAHRPALELRQRAVVRRRAVLGWVAVDDPLRDRLPIGVDEL